MEWFWDHADKVGSLSEFATAAVAAVALAFAWAQVVSVRQSQREATAKQIYMEYIKLAFENPKISSPEKADQEIVKDIKYRWFVAFLLNACDEILAANENDEGWKEVVRIELSYHRTYLGSRTFLGKGENEDRGWELYSDGLSEIGERVVKEDAH